MYNLEELKNGMHCTITWLLGDVGTFLKKKYIVEIIQYSHNVTIFP